MKRDTFISSSGGRNGYLRRSQCLSFKVETVLLNHPKVQEAAVVGIPDSEGAILRANVVLSMVKQQRIGDLSFCKERWPVLRCLDNSNLRLPPQVENRKNCQKAVEGDGDDLREVARFYL